MQIRVKVQNVSDSNTVKLKKIFKLSENRNKQYILVEEEVDLLITANPTYQDTGDIPVLTLGAVENFPNSVAHIRPPLLGVRVLKMLDTVDVIRPSICKETATETVTIPKAPDLNAETKSAYNILVVDDSALIHKALELELNKAEFDTNITFATSGENCLDLIKKNQFDFIFLDVMMPGIDGYETCTQIRKNLHYKKTPIIMISAKTSPLDEVKGVLAGCTTYLTKPVQHEEFQKLLVRMNKWIVNFNSSTLRS